MLLSLHIATFLMHQRDCSGKCHLCLFFKSSSKSEARTCVCVCVCVCVGKHQLRSVSPFHDKGRLQQRSLAAFQPCPRRSKPSRGGGWSAQNLSWTLKKKRKMIGKIFKALKAQTFARLCGELVKVRWDEDGVLVERKVECSRQAAEHKLWPGGEEMRHGVARVRENVDS